MIRWVLLFIPLLLSALEFKVATYNVENLFDAQNDGNEYEEYKPNTKHVHSESAIGDLLGFTTIQMKVPTFKNANPQSYYFLIITYLGTWLLGLFAIWWIHVGSFNAQ